MLKWKERTFCGVFFHDCAWKWEKIISTWNKCKLVKFQIDKVCRGDFLRKKEDQALRYFLGIAFLVNFSFC